MSGKKRVSFTRKKKGKNSKAGRPKKSAVAKAKAESLAKLEREYPVELMLTDWAVRHPDIRPMSYLVNIKGYTTAEAKRILIKVPAPDWYTAKQELIDGMTASLAKRQIDWAAEMHDLHFDASRVGLNSAIAWLNHQDGLPGEARDMRMVKVALDSIQVAQKIQRTALGLPTDDGAIHIYNNLIMKQQQISHISEDGKSPTEKLEDTLTLEEIRALAQIRSVQKREAIEAEIVGQDVV